MNAALLDFSEFEPIIPLIHSYRINFGELWVSIKIPRQLKLDVEKCKAIFEKFDYNPDIIFDFTHLSGTIASDELTQFLINELNKRTKVDPISSFRTGTCNISPM